MRELAVRGPLARWPAGFVCPGCGGGRAWTLKSKADTFECASCGRQTSVTVGAFLMATLSNGISALQLQAQPGLGSYRTAWMLAANLRRAMRAPGRHPLAGLVEVDESGLPLRTRDDPPAGSRGRSHDGKMLIAGAIEANDGKPGRLRLAALDDDTAASLHVFVRQSIAPGSTARTDGLSSYAGLAEVGHDPHVVGTTAAHIVLPSIHTADPHRLFQPEDLGQGRLPRPAPTPPAIRPR